VLAVTAAVPSLMLGAGAALAIGALAREGGDALSDVFMGSLSGRVESFLASASASLRYAASLATAAEGKSALRSFLPFFPEFDMLQRLDAAGRILEISPYDERFLGMDMSGQEYFSEARFSRRVAWSQGFVSVYSGNPSVTISIPLGAERIVGFLSLEELSRALSGAGLPRDAFGMIIDAYGVVIAHSNYRKALERISLDLGAVQPLLDAPRAAPFKFEGARYLARFARIGGSGWYVAVLQPEDAVRAAARRFLLFFSPVFLLSLAFGVFFAVRGARILRGAFAKLLAAAERVAEAPLSPGPGGDGPFLELDRVVAAFGAMEERVNEREASMLRAEEKLRGSLAEKEILLKEIHHRVKNNLQVVSSILRLQALSIEDESVGALFLDCQNRVQAMALIHEQLYRSESIASIGMRNYLENLVGVLWDSFDPSARGIKLELALGDGELPTELAVPCGLIAVELVTNALKYAYPAGGGPVRLAYEAKLDAVRLEVSDEGAGLPPNFDIHAQRSLGLSLVSSLVDQLKGELLVSGPPGARFEVRFRAPAKAPAAEQDP
ncbi:MAG: sensor histidine kinase, partial [Spirochaetaceae bacterium]|nr:sensor histidine kinase [Spirochaetaceae bacterium]